MSLPENALWSDKKRYFGLPISFTKYYIEHERLYIKAGFLTTTTDEVLLYRILDVKSSCSLIQRLFGVGTVSLYCADQSHNVLNLVNIKDYKAVHALISDTVEKIRCQRGIIGNEMVGTAN